MIQDTTNRLTWWESGDILVECRRSRDGWLVRTMRAGQISSDIPAPSERRARELFERIVERLVEEEEETNDSRNLRILRRN